MSNLVSLLSVKCRDRQVYQLYLHVVLLLCILLSVTSFVAF